MSYNPVARFLAITFAATLIGINSITLSLAKSSLPGNTIADSTKSGCNHNNGCFPPPV